MSGIARKKVITFALCFLIGLIIFLIPPPDKVNANAFHLLGIFVFTILGIITKPLPIGAIAFIGMTLTTVTNTLTFNEAFSGFNNHVVWLIVVAFFIARGFMKTGLGSRIAYYLMSLLGKSTLGMAYGMAATDLILAPAIPSVTARAGGVIYPVVNSLVRAFGSEPHSHPRKMGSYLMQTVFQGSLITSAMFLTSMAGNPLIADIARDAGVNITWGKWALAAIVPGLISLGIMPYFLYKVYPPEVKETPHAKEFAKKELKKMGKVSFSESVMIICFIVLISLWVAGPYIGMKAVVAALIGLSALLVTQVLGWDDIIKEKEAWNTLIWFSALIMMASYLNKLGLTTWFSDMIVQNIQGFNWVIAFSILGLIYFYTHYFFASSIAHIGAMYPPFLLLSIALGTPPILAALTLGFFSSLYGGLTHYGCGPAPIYFGSGFVKITDWWKLGFFGSIVNIVIWVGVGIIWWKAIGLY